MEFHPLLFNEGRRKLIICDLGGQEEFHSFHHYMMNSTHNDLFIVVCKLPHEDLHQDQFERELRYWLKFIVVHRRVGAVGSNSSALLKPKVLVVVNFFYKVENKSTIARRRAHQLMMGGFSEVLDFGGTSAGQHYRNLFGIRANKVTQVKAVENRLGTLLQELLGSGHSIPRLCSDLSERVLPSLMQSKHSRIKFSLRSTSTKPTLFLTYAAILQKCYEILPSGSSNQENMSKRVQAALLELHKQGALLFFPKEGDDNERTLVITDSGWFCQDLIGELLAVNIEQRKHSPYPHLQNQHPSISWRIEDIENMLTRQGCKEENLREIVRYLQDLELCFAVEDKDEIGTATHSENMKKLLFPALLMTRDVVYPNVVSKNCTDASENSTQVELFFGRRLQCQESSLHLVPSGVFTRLQVRLHKFSKNECYDLGYCWASFVKGNVGATIRFGGDVAEPWENKQWIDILVFCPRIISERPQQEEFEVNHRYLIAAENLMRQIKEAIYEICQSDGIPSVLLQELVLKHKLRDPPATELAVIKKDLKEQGLDGCSVNWPNNVRIPPTPVVELLLPTELDEYVSSQLITLARIRAEFSFSSSVDDVGGYSTSQQSLDGGKGFGKVPVLESEEDDEGRLAGGPLELEMRRFIRHEFKRYQRLQEKWFVNLKSEMHNMSLEMHHMNLALQLIRKDIQSLGNYLQEAKRNILFNCSTRLLEHELRKEHAHPLYPYLVDAESGKLGALKTLLVKKARLHFMCESPNEGPHPVAGQRGKQITIEVKEWLTKVARVIIPAFRVFCCLARIAATVCLPSTHVFIPSPDCLDVLGIEKEALQHVILPKALEALLDGVPDMKHNHLLTQQGCRLHANEVREAIQTILKNENIDMGSDFGLQRVSFGKGIVHWVCEKHRPVEGIPLESPSNPFK